MRDGVDATGPLPADRWDVAATYDPDPETPGRIATRGGGFLKDVRSFDPTFFGISRREAQGIDPQQRLLLEVAWEALEHGALPPDRLDITLSVDGEGRSARVTPHGRFEGRELGI